MFDPLNNAKKRTLQGYLASLVGAVGLTLLTDPDYEYDYGVLHLGGNAGGSIVATALKDASVIALSGITGANPSFLLGDRIGIAGSVYMVTADTNSVSGNIAALPIRPRLRADATAAAVTLTGLQYQMQLLDDKQKMAEINAIGHSNGFTLSFTEALT